MSLNLLHKPVNSEWYPLNNNNKDYYMTLKNNVKVKKDQNFPTESNFTISKLCIEQQQQQGKIYCKSQN